jgi:type VI secretion system secreted protein VgrG
LEQRITALEAALGMTPSGGTSHSKLTPRSLELDVSQSSEIDSGRNLTLEAGDQILLKVGKAQIRMTKSGLIDIRGTEISVKQNQVELIKGKKISDN